MRIRNRKRHITSRSIDVLVVAETWHHSSDFTLLRLTFLKFHIVDVRCTHYSLLTLSLWMTTRRLRSQNNLCPSSITACSSPEVSMDNQVNMLCRSCLYYLCQIRSKRHNLSFSAAMILLHSFFQCAWTIVIPSSVPPK